MFVCRPSAVWSAAEIQMQFITHFFLFACHFFCFWLNIILKALYILIEWMYLISKYGVKRINITVYDF